MYVLITIKLKRQKREPGGEEFKTNYEYETTPDGRVAVERMSNLNEFSGIFSTEFCRAKRFRFTVK